MKTIQLLLLLFISNTTIAQENNTNLLDSFTVKVDGMGCPYCSYGLDRTFKEELNIINPTIDIETGLFKFQYPSKDSLAANKIKNLVEKAGYTPVYLNLTKAGKTKQTITFKENANTTKSIEEKTSFYVYGNCGMCKNRIEKASNNLKGVSNASWNIESKMLTISFNKEKTSLKEIKKAINKVGHDTKESKATQKAYDKLHTCCKYER